MNNNNSYENQEITILVIQKTRKRLKLFLEVKEESVDSDFCRICR
jgi:hypothetical protein